MTFGVAGQKFKPDRCCLTDKRFEPLACINCNWHFKNLLLLQFPFPGNLKGTTGPPLSLYFGLSILLAFSKLLLFVFFGQFQRSTLVIGNDTHSKHFRKNCNPNLKFKRMVVARNHFRTTLTSDQFVWRKLRPLHHPLLCKN